MNNKVVKNVNGQVGEGVGFERIRRITGYLVGTLDRFNNGKRAEVEDLPALFLEADARSIKLTWKTTTDLKKKR